MVKINLMIKQILWDFDGVILDSMPVREYGFRKIFEDYNNVVISKISEENSKNSDFYKLLQDKKPGKGLFTNFILKKYGPKNKKTNNVDYYRWKNLTSPHPKIILDQSFMQVHLEYIKDLPGINLNAKYGSNGYTTLIPAIIHKCRYNMCIFNFKIIIFR